MTFLNPGNGRRPSRHAPLTGSSSKEQWQTMTRSIGSTAPEPYLRIVPQPSD